MEEQPTQSNTLEKNEGEGPVQRQNKRDEKKEKIIRRVKEVLAQSPNKDKNATVVIVICYRGKKKRNPSQLEKNEGTQDHSSSPNNTQ